MLSVMTSTRVTLKRRQDRLTTEQVVTSRPPAASIRQTICLLCLTHQEIVFVGDREGSSVEGG